MADSRIINPIVTLTCWCGMTWVEMDRGSVLVIEDNWFRGRCPRCDNFGEHSNGEIWIDNGDV